MNESDAFYLNLALKEAQKAETLAEVPVGAVIVKDGLVIGTGYNLKETSKDPTAHAELVAIRQATQGLEDWRLNGCTLFSTLEPCPMCAGAVLQSRISRVVYGAPDIRWGAAGSVLNLFSTPFNHQVVADYHPLAEAASIITTFFHKRRHG